MDVDFSNPTPRRVPPEFGSLFWDGNLATLDLDQHATQIIERVLQDGTLESVRWLLRVYGDDIIRKFIAVSGVKRLDPKILSFWYAYYDLGEPPCTKRSSLIGSERGWRY